MKQNIGIKDVSRVENKIGLGSVLKLKILAIIKSATGRGSIGTPKSDSRWSKVWSQKKSKLLCSGSIAKGKKIINQDVMDGSLDRQKYFLNK